MDKQQRVVYYEDLHNAAKPAPTVENASKDTSDVSKHATNASPPKDPSVKALAGVKRQATLMDMFSTNTASTKPGTNERTAKKLKVTASGSSLTTTIGPPTNFGLQPLNAIPFSQSAYVNSLTDDQKRLLRLECETMGKTWLKLLKDEIKKPYFITLKEFLWKEGVHGPDDASPNLKVYPSPRNIYSWSNYTPLGKVKVVIIGQDPYHGPKQAHGLCFSVPTGVSIPPSLHSIYREIQTEYPHFVPPKHGNLTAWASAGVLMLNACLTVRAGDAGSHSKHGWETFTDKVVDVVDRYGGASLPTADNAKTGHGRGVVFLAWGAFARSRVEKLDKKKHLVLESAHPSPKSAQRGFFGNGHFKKANEWLQARYGPEAVVDWCNLDPVPAK